MAGAAKPLDVGAIPYEGINEIIGNYKGDSSAIIPILQDIQELVSYVRKDGIAYMAEKLDVSPA